MRYRQITLENFLVFRGEQTIDVPSGTGVVVVYGRNGKGKTSLLNAFRWVWTGAARTRGSRIPQEGLTNSRALEENNGPVRCRVRLDFEKDGAHWDLTRSLTTSNGEVTEQLTLRKEGVALSVAEAEKQVVELMPPEIEQFFLFDGELLNQYEKLVDDDSNAGATLRAAIERVLGIPILENAAKDCALVAEAAGKLVADAAKRDVKTRKMGEALAQVQEQMRQCRENYEREDAKAKALEAEKHELEDRLAEHQNKIELKAKRDETELRLKERERELVELREQFKDLLSDSWRGVLVEPIEQRVDADELELETLEARLSELRFATVLAQHYQPSAHVCPVCEAHLEAGNRAALEQRLDQADAQVLAELDDRAITLKEQLKRLRKSGGHERRAQLRNVEDRYLKLETAIEDTRDDLADLDDRLKGSDDLNQLVQRSSKVEVLLLKAVSVYEQQRKLHEDARQQAEQLEAAIRKTGAGKADANVYARQQTAQALAKLFAKTIVIYRDQMKESVQDKATELFRSMRTEPDFKKLAINESYGLRILDTLGRPVPYRSAGYEHLVALSLLGALQASSPISGPLVMDSPFGRLDEQHVQSVVANLDKLSNQVFLLVHERELPRRSAPEWLRSRLLAEFELTRAGSARETEVGEVRHD